MSIVNRKLLDMDLDLSADIEVERKKHPDWSLPNITLLSGLKVERRAQVAEAVRLVHNEETDQICYEIENGRWVSIPRLAKLFGVKTISISPEHVAYLCLRKLTDNNPIPEGEFKEVSQLFRLSYLKQVEFMNKFAKEGRIEGKSPSRNVSGRSAK